MHNLLVSFRTENVVVDSKERCVCSLEFTPNASHDLNLAMLEQPSQIGVHVPAVWIPGFNLRLV